jgi:pantoate--beta-alanine ligase
MGFLHEGHLSLIRRAREQTDRVVVSVFVNPTQFGPEEDFQEYPRDLEHDVRLIGTTGGDVAFVPFVEEMYPQGYATYVHVEGLTAGLCGASRPGHFRGVVTVVTKLFCAVRPHVAVFGQKDAQQAFVIRRMTQDLNMGIEILMAPTIREPDGLAMSSRNVYLSPQERPHAAVLFQALNHARALVESGERSADRIIHSMRERILAEPVHKTIDYIALVDTETLQPLTHLRGGVLIALAVRIGKIRLIDNMIVHVDGGHIEP